MQLEHHGFYINGLYEAYVILENKGYKTHIRDVRLHLFSSIIMIVVPENEPI